MSPPPPPPPFYTKIRFYLIKSVIREMKMICFILKIRMSNCSLQPVTWQLYKLIQVVYTSRVILELFTEVLSHNPMLQIVGLIQLGTDHYFFIGGGFTIFGTCRQFFLKTNAFQTIFFITFCDENNFYEHFIKHYRLFYRSYLK